MFDVITIGGATQDVFVRSEGAQVIRLSDREQERAWIGFDYGAKIPVESIRFTVGGGATNTAVAMSKLGLKVASLINIGEDQAGDQVLESLIRHGVMTDLVCRSQEQTGYSVILTSYEGERSILAFRGANCGLTQEGIDWERLKQTRWFYISSLSGASDAVLDPLLDFAQAHQIKVAWNPGGTQLKSPKQLLRRLSQVHLLFVNKEEAAQITDLALAKPLPEHLRTGAENLDRPGYMYDLDTQLKVLKQSVQDLVVITDGHRGTQAYDGLNVTIMPVYPVEIADVLGAGDAFGASFTSAWLDQRSVSECLSWGAANAASVVTDPGAHRGLLNASELGQMQSRYQIESLSYPLAQDLVDASA